MYLQRSDYKKLIQADNLTAIINSDNTILNGIELLAQAEAISYLVQKYIVTEEFADLLTWAYATAYKAKQRVTLDAVTYSAAATYALNVLTLQAGNVYICTTAIISPEAFNASKWELLGAQYTIFYVTLPNPEFDYTETYKVNDLVWYKNKVYTCKIATGSLSQEQAIQYGLTTNIPNKNIFPDDTTTAGSSTMGVIYWGAGVAYTVAAGTRPTDATKWTAGDNRSQQLVMVTVDIALYHVHSRIAPNNIPDLRAKRYDDAVKWLKMAGQGDITAALPLIQPKSGARIRWGGRVKNVNSY